MSAEEMVFTSLALGALVFLAGCYGMLYCIGRLRESPGVIYTAYGTYAAQVALTFVIVLLTSLGDGWKLLIVASSAAYLPIPPVTWRYLAALHESMEPHS